MSMKVAFFLLIVSGISPCSITNVLTHVINSLFLTNHSYHSKFPFIFFDDFYRPLLAMKVYLYVFLHSLLVKCWLRWQYNHMVLTFGVNHKRGAVASLI